MKTKNWLKTAALIALAFILTFAWALLGWVALMTVWPRLIPVSLAKSLSLCLVPVWLWLAGLAVLGALAAKWRTAANWVVAVLALGMGPMLAYLITDDAESSGGIVAADLGPMPADAAASVTVLARYNKDSVAYRAYEARRKLSFWRKGMTDAELARLWNELAPFDAWWMELDRFSELANAVPEPLDFNLTVLVPLDYIRVAGDLAEREARAGRPDRAADLLAPILSVIAKLDAGARSSNRLQEANLLRIYALRHLERVLDIAMPSAPHRTRLRTLLEKGPKRAEAVRRYVGAYHADMRFHSVSIFAMLNNDEYPLWEQQIAFKAAKVFYNPVRTTNDAAIWNAKMMEYAAAQDKAGFDAELKAFQAKAGRPPFKNFLGHRLVHKFTYINPYVIESMWKNEDRRSALIARLRAVGTESVETAAQAGKTGGPS